MTNEKTVKKDTPFSYSSLYNEGRYGKIENKDLNENLINQRVVSEDHFATIKYVGNIPGSTGDWLGVDWDDDSRGRHNGTYKGTKYFDTSSIKSGSFVRPSKVSLGLTIEEALQVRYGAPADDSNYVLDEFFLESSDSDGECGTSGVAPRSHTHQKVKVHISGMTNNTFNVSAGQMERLKSAMLHSLPLNRCLTVAEGGGKLADMVPNLVELDIAQTLISDWKEISKICIQLPKLRQLNVSDNKLQAFRLLSDESRQLFKDAFRDIKYLVLVRIYYTWDEFYQLFDYFPAIEHLCLAYNKLSNILPSVHENFENLNYIDLACNEIDNFDRDILPFGALKCLETLLLNENKIENIDFPGKLTEDSDLFPKLGLLAISNNKISSWSTLHHLSRLKSLKELIFMFNPILEQQKNQETARQDVIAKMQRIKILNRNEIKHEERKGAEIDYLKRYGKKWLESQPAADDTEDVKVLKERNLQDFFNEHPRFLKLIDICGAPEQSEMKICESDKNFVNDCELFLSTSESLIENILSAINWSRDYIENSEIKDICKYNFNHSVNLSSINSHESKCFMLNNGWSREEYESIPKISLKSVTGDGFGSDHKSELNDLEERLQARINQSDNQIDNYNSDLLSSEARNRRKKELDLLAEVRDIKRKRQSYRVYKEIKSQTEIHREIITHQMEMLKNLDNVQRQMDGMSDDDRKRKKKHAKKGKHKSRKSKHSKSKKKKSRHHCNSSD